MNRRAFLGLAAGVVTLAGCSADRLALRDRIAPFLERIEAHFDGGDLESVRTVGRQVVRTIDDADAAEALFEPVLALLDDDADLVAATLDDLATDAFLVVSGWTLARTEAALAAMLVY